MILASGRESFPPDLDGRNEKTFRKDRFIMSVITVLAAAAAAAAGLYAALAAGAAVCIGTTLIHGVEKKGSRFPA